MGVRTIAAILVALTCAFAFSGPALAQDAPAAAAAPDKCKGQVDNAPPECRTQAAQLEAIVVTGINASMEKSLEIKKDAPVILDSINAIELGRFPDDDVADSLSHLPGITITRTTGGEGQKVSVRGLGPQYNIVTLNNRILATDDDSRDLAFDVLPSEIISGAEVLKSPQASAVEGSIGGTVNLRTASPFENPGFHGGIHAEADDDSTTKLHGKKYSAYAENTNDAKTMGVLVGVVHYDNNVRTDSLNAYNQNIYGPTSYPFTNTSPQTIAVSPCCITFGSIFDEKKRDAISGKFEWQPSESFHLVTDALYTHLNDPQVGYNESYYFPYATDSNGNPEWFNPVIQNGLVTAVTTNNFQPEMVNNTMNRVVNTSMYGVNATWKPAPKWSFTGDMYQSKAKRPEGGQDTFVTAGLVSKTPDAVDILNMQDVPNSLPNLNVAIPPSQLGLSACPAGSASASNPGYCSYTSLMNSGFLNNNKYWSTHYVGLNGYTVHDMVSGLTLDGSYDWNKGHFDRVLFGVGLSRREKGRWDDSNDWNNGSGQYGNLYQTAGCPGQCNPYSFASQGYNVISMVNIPNFMQGAGGSYPVILPRLNSNALMAFLQSLNGKPNPYYCGNATAANCSKLFNFSQTMPALNPYNSYDVSERTTSLYGELEFSGTNWAGNVGLRIVRTSTVASTAEAVPASLSTTNPNSSTPTYVVNYSSELPVASYGQYTIPLPSANFSDWLVPEKLQMRLGLAQVMSRPDLNELAPTSTNNAINGQPQLYYGGTAGLRPIKAYQADASLEWYYQPHAALTGTLFGKKIRDDIYSGVASNVDLGTKLYSGGLPGTVPAQPFPWTVQAPANGARSLFYGIELTWQHVLANGFGAHVQYTHTISKGWDQNGNFVGPINAVPPTTMTIGLIYEKGPISADVNWDRASSYTYECSECTEVPGWPAIADAFSWVTASAHYHITKELEVYAEGKNLTNAVARTYLNGNPLLAWAPGQSVGQSASGVGAGYSAFGRMYTAGFAFRF